MPTVTGRARTRTVIHGLSLFQPPVQLENPMILTLRSTLVSLAVAGLLAACASPVKLDDTPVETRTPTPVAGADGKTGANGATSAGTAQSSVATVDLSKPAAGSTAVIAGPAERVVLFDFDSYVIKDEYRAVVEGHAKALAASRNRHMSVEGHTDERGGREYNLALGQRRAEAVARAMVLLGAGEAQIEATSFGKERPVALGHDEAAWAQNRRAELKDR